jgi:hypothetical protein
MSSKEKTKKVSVSKSFQAFFNTLNKREVSRESSTEEKSVIEKSNNNKATTQKK